MTSGIRNTVKERIKRELLSEANFNRQEQQALLDTKYYKALLAADQKGGQVKTKPVREIYKAPSIEAELKKRLRAASGLKPGAKTFDLAVFKDAATKTEYKKIYDTLDKYVAAFPTPKNLVFIGAAGTGKTHAAQVLGSKLLDRGFSVFYITAFALIQRFKDYIFNFEADALDNIFGCDLLVIDDLGTEPKIKNISEEYLLNVINERMANDTPFAITTNLSPDDILARYDQRLTSRILAKQSSVVFRFKGKDLRF